MSAQQRLEAVQRAMRRACGSAGRNPAEITLIAVSKGHPAEAIRELYDLGLRHFGESRLQDALPKMEALPPDITWHFIGTLQTNKARRIAERFAVIHSVDKREHLREVDKSGGTRDLLVEVNIAAEPQKAGVLSPDLDAFLKEGLQYSRARVRGLMGIGAAGLPIEEKRKEFQLLFEEASRRGLPWISMGMSDDFGAAIQEGATHIRVGTALFGARRTGGPPEVE